MRAAAPMATDVAVGDDSIASPARTVNGSPRRSTSRWRTARIWSARGMSAGQTVVQAPHETQSDCGPSMTSRPWWNGVTTRPMAPV